MPYTLALVDMDRLAIVNRELAALAPAEPERLRALFAACETNLSVGLTTGYRDCFTSTDSKRAFDGACRRLLCLGEVFYLGRRALEVVRVVQHVPDLAGCCELLVAEPPIPSADWHQLRDVSEVAALHKATRGWDDETICAWGERNRRQQRLADLWRSPQLWPTWRVLQNALQIACEREQGIVTLLEC